MVKMGTGSTTLGKVYYWKASTGSWALLDSNNTVNQIRGMAAWSIGTDPDVDGMMLQGFVAAPSHGFTLGVPLYVSSTAGDLTSYSPKFIWSLC